MILQGASLDDPHASRYPDWAAWDNSSPFCPSPLHNMQTSIKKFRAWIKSKPWHDNENGKVTDAAHAVKFLITVGMFARDLHAAQFAEEDDDTLPATVINTKHDFKVVNETLTPLCEELLTDLSAAAKPRPRPRPSNAQAGSSKRKVSPGFFHGVQLLILQPRGPNLARSDCIFCIYNCPVSSQEKYILMIKKMHAITRRRAKMCDKLKTRCFPWAVTPWYLASQPPRGDLKVGVGWKTPRRPRDCGQPPRCRWLRCLERQW